MISGFRSELDGRSAAILQLRGFVLRSPVGRLAPHGRADPALHRRRDHGRRLVLADRSAPDQPRPCLLPVRATTRLARSFGKIRRLQLRHVVKFRSGRYVRSWVGNVVSSGTRRSSNRRSDRAANRIEASTLADALLDSLVNRRPRSSNSTTGTKASGRYSNFLAIHYRSTPRLQTPLWRACQADVALHGFIVDWYRENGLAPG